MKFYITEETRKELKAEIAEIEKQYFQVKGNDDADEHYLDGKRTALKEILSDSIILPVKNSWEELGEYTGTFFGDDAEVLDKYFENGVVIESK